MKRLLFLFLMLDILATAQDFHYSQLDQSLTLINPATTSTFSGFERITLQHRNQWLGAGTQFMTSMGMAEFSIGKIARKKSAYSGVGVYFMNDVGGDSKFSIKTGGVTASGVLPIARSHTISAGIHAAFSNRSADFSRISFMNQWNGYHALAHHEVSYTTNMGRPSVTSLTQYRYLAHTMASYNHYQETTATGVRLIAYATVESVMDIFQS